MSTDGSVTEHKEGCSCKEDHYDSMQEGNGEGEIGIWSCARDGDYEKVRVFLEQGFPVNSRDKSGNTALHYAARKGRYELCELLLDYGADVNSGAVRPKIIQECQSPPPPPPQENQNDMPTSKSDSTTDLTNILLEEVLNHEGCLNNPLLTGEIEYEHKEGANGSSPVVFEYNMANIMEDTAPIMSAFESCVQPMVTHRSVLAELMNTQAPTLNSLQVLASEYKQNVQQSLLSACDIDKLVMKDEEKDRENHNSEVD